MKKYLTLERLIHFGMLISMANCFIMVIITILDVLSRHLLHRPVPGVIELNEVLMVGIVFLGLGMAQKEKAHIRAELFVSRLPPKLRRLFDLLALIFSACFWVMLLTQAVPRAWGSYLTGEYREGLIKFPIWPARWALAIGILILCLQLVRDFYRTISSNEYETMDS